MIEQIGNLNFNIVALEWCCYTPENDFLEYLQQYYPHARLVDTPNDGRQLIHVDNGSAVLGIVHLDATMNNPHFAIGKTYRSPDDLCAFNTMVDDRAGAFAMIHLLPQLDINVDLLFSVGEEDGMSTSAHFEPQKEYNWQFQFDRGGTDVVHYQYQDFLWLGTLKTAFGAKQVSPGICSDLCYLEQLGAMGVNIGTGYYDYTRGNAYVSLNDLGMMVEKFKGMYDNIKNTPFRFDPAITKSLSPFARMALANYAMHDKHKRVAGTPLDGEFLKRLPYRERAKELEILNTKF